MIIRSIKLKNYRRFRELELELPENLIGIVGNNGAGKTTIVEAIGWCLYGNRIRRTDKQDVRSQCCGAGETCSVELIFTCGDHEYRIVRQLKGRAANVEAALYLNADREPIAVQERGVNDYVEQLLNLDYRSFFISVFARQKDLAAISTLQPEDRRKSIARLINIETIDRARNDIRTDRSTKEARLAGITSSLKDESELKEQEKQLKLKLDAVVQSREELNQKLLHLQEQMDGLKQEFEAQNQIRDQYQSIQARIEKWKSRQADFESRLRRTQQNIEAIQKAKQELEFLRPQLADYNKIQREKERLDKESVKYFQLKAKEEELQRLAQRITKEQVALTRLDEELKALAGIDQKVIDQNNEIARLETERENLRKQLSSVEGQKLKVREKGVEIKEKRTKIESLGPESPCPVCTRPLHDHYDQVLAQFDADLNRLRQEFLALSEDEKKLNQAVAEISEKLKQTNQFRDGLLQAQEQFRERDKQRNQTKERLEDLLRSQKQLKGEVAEIGKVEYNEADHQELKKKLKLLTELRDQALKFEEQLKRLPDEQQELQQITATLKDLAAEIAQEHERLFALNFDEAKYLSLKQQVEKQQRLIDQVREQIHETEQEIVRIQKDNDYVKNELNTIRRLQQEIDQLKQEIVDLKLLDHHLGVFRQELSGRIRPLIANRASELLHLTTQGRYSVLELDDDYNIYLYDQANRFPLARFSGGEQDLANLCLRIAISQVVAERSGRSQINFIVLDEIFGSQDEQRKDLILNALQHLSSQFRQIFIISHVEGIKDALPVIISVEEKSLDESVAKLL
ncbi:MAG: SMC family ATPase [candidate division KSB1 bacterium]|nr:SMC family ATPase [candidate division KSB1 bacterium]MDZ7335709.1 SMC family ATPase [candidate division KSB1 bacterium]MDZ7358550.1 SMC family ATPase [candidate division KSB1 bacterium]MDZ7401640.1 SMC family ATPase [candidate division KSB1 bacterium]